MYVRSSNPSSSIGPHLAAYPTVTSERTSDPYMTTFFHTPFAHPHSGQVIEFRYDKYQRARVGDSLFGDLLPILDEKEILFR